MCIRDRSGVPQLYHKPSVVYSHADSASGIPNLNKPDPKQEYREHREATASTEPFLCVRYVAFFCAITSLDRYSNRTTRATLTADYLPAEGWTARLSAPSTALIEANSILVSVAAPKKVSPDGVRIWICLLYTSDAADERSSVD